VETHGQQQGNGGRRAKPGQHPHQGAHEDPQEAEKKIQRLESNLCALQQKPEDVRFPALLLES
jgi:hypothetical protein